MNPSFSFQVNKLDKAVAAANTFFQANPDHVEMRQNLEYYRMMAGVQEEDFKDLEARTHMVRENLSSHDFQYSITTTRISTTAIPSIVGSDLIIPSV